MLQPGSEPDLAEEAVRAHTRGQLGMEHLERDGPVVPQVAGEVHRGHPAAAELALERVAVGQRGCEPRREFRTIALGRRRRW